MRAYLSVGGIGWQEEQTMWVADSLNLDISYFQETSVKSSCSSAGEHSIYGKFQTSWVKRVTSPGAEFRCSHSHWEKAGIQDAH